MLEIRNSPKICDLVERVVDVEPRTAVGLRRRVDAAVLESR